MQEEIRWRMVAESLTRPYRVTFPMVALVMLVPFYIFIGEMMPGRTLHIPALAFDRALPLRPTWALVYGTLYLFLIVLPVFVVRQEEQIRRTVFAYLTIWISAYVIFLAYPTMASRPAEVIGKGFAVWGLRFLYDADPPYNCFPSLHVAHSFVSALTCYRVHRGVGIVAMICASLVGLSTLFTKQHYILDVVAGILLAYAAYAILLRSYPRDEVPDLDRRLAPVLALCVIAILGIALACFWVAYRLREPVHAEMGRGGEPRVLRLSANSA
jgi:membrane-associated phospholipid phosphatase